MGWLFFWISLRRASDKIQRTSSANWSMTRESGSLSPATSALKLRHLMLSLSQSHGWPTCGRTDCLPLGLIGSTSQCQISSKCLQQKNKNHKANSKLKYKLTVRTAVRNNCYTHWNTIVCSLRRIPSQNASRQHNRVRLTTRKEWSHGDQYLICEQNLRYLFVDLSPYDPMIYNPLCLVCVNGPAVFV